MITVAMNAAGCLRCSCAPRRVTQGVLTAVVRIWRSLFPPHTVLKWTKRSQALHVVAGKNVAKNRPAPAVTHAEGDERMSPIVLEPRYSTKELQGKCIKCLTKQELGVCLSKLLRGEIENKELVEKYEALVSFLKSPVSRKLRDVCERYLSQGKEVRAKIYFWHGTPKYKIILS